MQDVPGSNPGAAPPTLEPISPIPLLQVAKMRQGSRKGWCTRKLGTRDDKKNYFHRKSLLFGSIFEGQTKILVLKTLMYRMLNLS